MSEQRWRSIRAMIVGRGNVPFKSKAQRRKFAELLVDGKISPETYEEWNRETGSKLLPERVKPTAGTRKRRTIGKKRKPARRQKRARAK
jgi:hypothetical protein